MAALSCALGIMPVRPSGCCTRTFSAKLGALATGAYNGYGYGYGCVANRPVYDDWGNFVGYRRVRAPCY